MKKLLVLMLVLGVSSLASAAYMLENESPEVGILTGDGNFAAYFISADKGIDIELVYQGTLRNKTNMSGDLEPFLGAGNHWFMEYADGGQPGSQILPNGIVSRITAVNPDDLLGLGITVKLLDSNDLSQIGADVMLTPEPISLALLGLGGLFLRRRK